MIYLILALALALVVATYWLAYAWGARNGYREARMDFARQQGKAYEIFRKHGIMR